MSTLRVANLQSTAGTQTVTQDRLYRGAATAWVNFNGTGTVAIRDSYNVSSITDNGVGDYTVNFQTALANVNYSCVATGNFSSGVAWVATPYAGTTPATTNIRIRTIDVGGAADLSYVNVTIFGGY